MTAVRYAEAWVPAPWEQLDIDEADREVKAKAVEEMSVKIKEAHTIGQTQLMYEGEHHAPGTQIIHFTGGENKYTKKSRVKA